MSARKRAPAARVGDFDDVALPFTDAHARWEAARCLGCHDAPCNTGCDATIDVRSFVQLIHFGDPIGAAEVIRRTNVFGGACARVCNAAGQCQLRCTRSKLDRAVDIAGLQAYAMAVEQAAGPRPLPVGPESGKSVAIVGAGPAGLSAAAELRRLGHRAVVLEGTDHPGGLLNDGIPAFRLPRDIVQNEVDTILQAGVELRLNQQVASLEELRGAFDGVIVCVGLNLGARLRVDGEDLGGVIAAIEVLDGSVTDLGDRPVVVGGGNTAMDAATTAVRRIGTKGRVTVLYRRAAQHMPAFEHERHMLEEEGVILRPLTVVDRILGDPDGRVAAIRCRAVDLGTPDASGRPQPVDVSGGVFDLPATTVIVAAGEEADPDLLELLGLTGDTGSRTSRDGRTKIQGVYVAGDLASGPRTVAWAVGSGRRAAAAFHEDTKGDQEADAPVVYPVLGPKADLSVDFVGKTLPNPFLLAAAPSTDDLEMARAGLQAGWGGVVLKTTSVEGTDVSLKYPMICSVDRGPRMMAALGNIDLISEHHLELVEERVKTLKQEFPDRFIAASIMGETREQWQKLARRLSGAGADAIECSFSCPQGTLGSRPGGMLGQDPKLVQAVTRWVKDAAGETPVVIKITPQVADVAEIATAVAAGGADAICAANSIPGLAGIDVEQICPAPPVGGRTSFSGISGPAILPLSLRTIAEVARATPLPVTGTGGPESWTDAVAMMLVGARNVQFCTAVMHYGFRIIDFLKGGLSRYLERHELGSVEELVGQALPKLVGHDELDQPGPVRAKVDKDTCIGCGCCHIACHDGGHRAIEWTAESRLPTVDLERCVGCGLCSGVCPTASISYLALGR